MYITAKADFQQELVNVSLEYIKQSENKLKIIANGQKVKVNRNLFLVSFPLLRQIVDCNNLQTQTLIIPDGKVSSLLLLQDFLLGMGKSNKTVTMIEKEQLQETSCLLGLNLCGNFDRISEDGSSEQIIVSLENEVLEENSNIDDIILDDIGNLIDDKNSVNHLQIQSICTIETEESRVKIDPVATTELNNQLSEKAIKREVDETSEVSIIVDDTFVWDEIPTEDTINTSPIITRANSKYSNNTPIYDSTESLIQSSGQSMSVENLDIDVDQTEINDLLSKTKNEIEKLLKVKPIDQLMERNADLIANNKAGMDKDTAVKYPLSPESHFKSPYKEVFPTLAEQTYSVNERSTIEPFGEENYTYEYNSNEEITRSVSRESFPWETPIISNDESFPRSAQREPIPWDALNRESPSSVSRVLPRDCEFERSISRESIPRQSTRDTFYGEFESSVSRKLVPRNSEFHGELIQSVSSESIPRESPRLNCNEDIARSVSRESVPRQLPRFTSNEQKSRSVSRESSRRYHEGNSRSVSRESSQGYEINSKSVSRESGIRESPRFPCVKCNYSTYNIENIKKHVKETHKCFYIFRCEVCSFSSPIYTSLKKHRCSKEAVSTDTINMMGRELSCTECSFRSSVPGDMMHHSKRFHGILFIFTCPNCPFSCRSHPKFLDHIPSCDSVTSNAPVPSLVCFKCGRRHFELCSVPSDTVCSEPYCPAPSGHARSLHHPTDNKDYKIIKHKCPELNIIQPTNKSFTKTLAKPKQPLHRCTRCSYMSAKPENVKLHARKIHKQSHLFVCEKCNFSTPEPRSLSTHMCIMNRPLSRCLHCDFTADKPQLVMRHVKSQHEDITSRQNIQLDPGMRDTTLACQVCGVRLLNMTALKRHMTLSHTTNTTYSDKEEGQVFSCDLCPYDCWDQDNLDRHVKSSHSFHPAEGLATRQKIHHKSEVIANPHPAEALAPSNRHPKIYQKSEIISNRHPAEALAPSHPKGNHPPCHPAEALAPRLKKKSSCKLCLICGRRHTTYCRYTPDSFCNWPGCPSPAGHVKSVHQPKSYADYKLILTKFGLGDSVEKPIKPNK